MSQGSSDANEPEPADAFIEHMGRVAKGDGLPRIAGRLFGFLILYGGPYSLSELAKNLQVSRGSVSTNTRLLEQLGVLERVSRRGDRQDYFQLHSDPYPALLQGVLARTKVARSGVAQAHEDLPDDWDGAKARLAALDTFYKRVRLSTEAVVRDYENGTDSDAPS